MAKSLQYHFDVTIPAGIAKAAPLVTLTPFEQNTVYRIEWLFPPGCQGNVGIQIGARSVAIIPQPNTSFIVRSGSASGYDIEDHHNTGDWSVIGYNTGAHPHTIQVTFFAHRNQPAPELDRLITETPELVFVGEG